LIPHFSPGVFARVFGPEWAVWALCGLGPTHHSHNPVVQMELVRPFLMVSEGKEKLGIGNFGIFFLPSTERSNCRMVL
jgi:hypothetical protein